MSEFRIYFFLGSVGCFFNVGRVLLYYYRKDVTVIVIKTGKKTEKSPVHLIRVFECNHGNDEE